MIKKIPIKLIAFMLSLSIIIPAYADNIILNADNKVEYHQKEQKLVASGNATATKGDLKIKAETLIGYYNASASNKISRIIAEKKVEMYSPQAEAFGDTLTYSIDDDKVTLKGSPARIKTADATITAQGDIIYYQSQQKAVATDNVTVIDNKGNKVFADLMNAWFTKDKNGKIILDKIDIEQNIKITSNNTEVTALKGTYYAIDGKIKLFDNVIINQNGNILKGSKAETNLNTGISKILSDGKSGRVSGIFKEKKD